MISFCIPRKPMPAPRPRFGNGKVYNEDWYAKWLRDASELARKAMAGREPFTGAVTVTVHARLQVPTSWPKWKRQAALAGKILATNKPDADNYLKSAMDAMNGVVFLDDAQVIKADTEKIYTLGPAETHIAVTPINWAAPAAINTKAEFEEWQRSK